MSLSLKRNKFLQLFHNISNSKITHRGPLILRLYGLLNELDLANENRFILCNFIDQNSELFSLGRDIYEINNDVTLKQLFLFAYSKARINNLIPNLYSEYINSINAISQKIDTQSNLS
ncbi:MAG TPA: hypothetical protein VMV43_13375 [Candidatus Nanopelagicaceae bacterium]|jgi:hypothetical protein|nr:hypothetical protein [Candidatus Nanopelagicaceae bacterium]